MIEVASTGGTLSFSADLPAGSRAYVDRDWLPGGRSGTVPAVVAATDDEAALALLAVAVEAAEAVSDAPAGSVEVIGTGVIAEATRALVRSAGGDGLRILVDTTGDPAVIVDATKRLRDLGTLVLAGEPLDRRLTIDLYADVHRRGLELRGIPGASTGRAADDPQDLVAKLFRETLRELSDAAPLPDGGLWFRLGA